MVIEIHGTIRENIGTIMRRVGYSPHFDRYKQEMTYARKLQGTMFPRYHIHIWEERSDYLKINLHLDAKRESYQGTSMHAGEYDTPAVIDEGNRIKALIEQMIARAQKQVDESASDKKGFWKGLFS